ncbi:unnamed protein product [Periconia digitata]|uniref:SAP domain-containing protein n=1 Tax=Periconia digitata TaxID=1303443 RepID=A0A9W4UI27_9PLEO|nr:unnamed protein product [Periconia digitata]
MTDYNKQTVANLRQLLKERSIPSTGLTRKAQIIEKLEEWDIQQSAPAQVEASLLAVDAKATEQDAREKEAEDTAADDGRSGGKVDGDEAQQITEAPESNPEEDVNMSMDNALEASAAIAPAPVAEHIEKGTEINTDVVVPDVPPSGTTTTAGEEPSVSIDVDSLPTERTPSSAPDEKPSIEKAQLLPIPERSATTTAEPGTRLNTEELEAETRKRKRRSQTPELTAQDVQVKKPRPDDAKAPEIHIQEDKAENSGMDSIMEQAAPEAKINETGQRVMDTTTDSEGDGDAQKVEQPTSAIDPAADSTPTASATASVQKEKAPRYRELLKPTETMETVETTAPTTSEDRPIVPALHPATPAIYIRNLMRPLRPDLLRAHLVSLASPPSGSPDASIIKSLFLDGMKTHALVHFTTTTAASRARASLHGSIWPPEGNRKELWVDFIPDDKVSDWIQQEEDAIASDKAARSSGRVALAQKFEVVYPDTENGIQAVFQVVGSATTTTPAVAASSDWNPPTSPRRRRASSPRQQISTTPFPPTAAPEETRHNIAKSFATLDDLFSSTKTSKPKLYFKPASPATVSLRLKELDRETSVDWTPEEKRKGRGLKHAGFSRGDQMIRYTFDEKEDEMVVEIGDDFGVREFEGGSGGFGWRGGGYGRGRGGGGRARGGGDRFTPGGIPRDGGGFWRGGGKWRSGN